MRNISPSTSGKGFILRYESCKKDECKSQQKFSVHVGIILRQFVPLVSLSFKGEMPTSKATAFYSPLEMSTQTLQQ